MGKKGRNAVKLYPKKDDENGERIYYDDNTFRKSHSSNVTMWALQMLTTLKPKLFMTQHLHQYVHSDSISWAARPPNFCWIITKQKQNSRHHQYTGPNLQGWSSAQ